MKFILAGTNSGCGKTTVSMGLMRLFTRKGYQVAPFKTGPDFIDPMFHEAVTGRYSYNLDSYMLAPETVRQLFLQHSQSSEVSIVEGVMGLFDGLGKEGQGSAAELSELLGLPVLLVVNCKALYQSVAAIVAGFANYHPNVHVKGVLLNQISSKEHFTFLKELIEEKTGVSCLGYIPYNKEFNIESRHLGLLQAEEVEHLMDKIDELANRLEETIDYQELLKWEAKPLPSQATKDHFEEFKHDLSWLRLGVAYDKAFRFYYRDNLELLERNGAKLSYFSPLKDEALPEGINALYIGGGYPEVFAEQLSSKQALMAEIKHRAEAGLPVFAECGGLMYLCSSILCQGKEHPMVGIFNCSTEMTSSLQRFGYATIEYKNGKGKCHEFHRSKIVSKNKEANYSLNYHLHKPEKNKTWECGLSTCNVLAGYAHIHFYTDPSLFSEIIQLWKRAII